MQLIFPTKTYSLQRAQNIHASALYRGRKLHQHKISTYNPQNVDKILLQCKTSTYNPQNVDKILHQRKISTYSPENMDEILLQCKTSTYCLSLKKVDS